MSLERKIEAALDNYFRAEGWFLFSNNGDHYAECYVNDEKVEINLTECTKALAERLE